MLISKKNLPQLSGLDIYSHQWVKQNHHNMITVDFKREHQLIAMNGVLNAPSLPGLFEKIPETTLKRGDAVICGRHAPPYVYLVAKGMVKLNSFHDGKEMLEDYLKEGEMFNCGALFQQGQKDLWAEAMTHPTALKKIPVRQLRQAMNTNALLYEDVMASVSASLGRTRERLRRLTLLSSRRRVIHFLAHHVEAAGRRVGYEYVIKPLMTHQQIGNIAGTSRQTATTVMNELRRQGIIHFTRSYLIVRDMDALLKMTGKQLD
jgi:CRP/FNR family transcriptional regulator, cyclic AMP receptor protein